MKKQIKVLMVVLNLGVSNGVSSFAMNYYRNIDHQRIKMDFVLFQNIPSLYYREIQKYDSKIYILPPLAHYKEHITKCKEILSSCQYDIIHDNTLLISYPLMNLAKISNVHVRILHSHNSKLGETTIKAIRNRLFLPLLRKTATHYAACSKIAATVLFGDMQYDYVPNVIIDDNFVFSESKRKEIREKMSVSNKIVIGSVGRISKQKNPLFALEVIACLAKSNLAFEYWWIGSGPLEKEFRDKINSLGLNDIVKVLGNRDDVKDLYQAIDILFMPSYFEGLGIVLVESQAMGLPIVTSDTIPKEVAYTDLISFLSLKKEKDLWATEIKKKAMMIDSRRSYSNELANSVYSCKNAGSNLLNLYMHMIGNTSTEEGSL